MGIAKFLKAGRISVNQATKQIEIADKQLILPYEKLNDWDWGFVYEKYVGQILENEGYAVTYQGLEKGLLDRGIDLIAIKDNEMKFIQCKYTRSHISRSKIEWILYKASGLLNENYKKSHLKLHFTLVISNKDESFSKKKPKNFSLNFTDMSKVEYPILQYFLDHNYIQDKIKLEVREIETLK
jgi:Holliday junction resolvase-like predicted endonuclease